MKTILRLNEEKNICTYVNEGYSCSKNNKCTFPNCRMKLKFIQVNDGFVIGGKPVFIPNIGQYLVNANGTLLDKITSDNFHLIHSIDFKVLFATPNLNLENVPNIEEKKTDYNKIRKEFFSEHRTMITEISEKNIGELAAVWGYEQAQQELYTKEQVIEAIQLAREADSIDGIVDLDVVLHYGHNNDLRCKWNNEEIFKQLKQVKVKITFENNKPVKC